MVTTVSKNAHLGAAILLGIATFLLFLTCITAPVVDQLYLYEVEYRMATAARPVRVGIWGYCILDLKPCVYLPSLALLGTMPRALEGAER